MRIAQLSPLFESVPPKLYGGTERVVSWLTEALVRRGHEVVLFGTGDSVTKAELVSVVPEGLRVSGAVDPVIAHFLEIDLLRERVEELDVVHSHLDCFGYSCLSTFDPPLVTTLHGRLDVPGLAPLMQRHRDKAFVSISDAQRGPIGEFPWAGTVYHGLPVQEYPFRDSPGDHLAFLGRMSPEKRPDVAIRIAREVGARLVLAAKVDRVDQEFFDAKVRPLLKEPGIEYIGEVDDAQKVELLGSARGLFFPILWPEPFGLVMIEAMACGTPVVTRRCGSTEEVVSHGRDGYVCDSDEELVGALERLDEIDRAECRRTVEARFCADTMAEQYESVYRRLIESESSASRSAATQGTPLEAG